MPNSGPRFILIDHSIQNTVGHHYQYAVHVLDAASQAGYAPILAASVDFEVTDPTPWKVLPIYKCGFWPRMAKPSRRRSQPGTVAAAVRWLKRARARLAYSKLGFLWLIRRHPMAYLQWHPFDAPFGMGPTVFLAATFAPIYHLAALCAQVLPFRDYFSHVGKATGASVRTAAGHVGNLTSPQGVLGHWRFLRRKRAQFAEDTLALLKSLDPNPDDIVFIPTLEHAEMLSLLNCFQTLKAASLPSYHLVFRRNLYEGREPDYPRQDQHLSPIRNAFLEFHTLGAAQRVFFYTDSEELTRQYNRLNVFQFRTCPIPHTYPPQPETTQQEPRQITYLGDARSEKGYHHLPALVGDLWQDWAETGRVKFAFQSNYNVSPGEAEAVVARCQLGAYPPERVRLLTESLSPNEYRELLATAQVMILPYHRDHYYARSSGVLIEALAAGVPVVVPAASWLWRQIADPSYRYLATLSGGAGSLPVTRKPIWVREGASRLRTIKEIEFGGETEKAYTWLTVPVPARSLLVSFIVKGGPGEFVTCYTDQVDVNGERLRLEKRILGQGNHEVRAAFLANLEAGTRRIWLAFRNSFSDSPSGISDLTIEFLSGGRDGATLPCSAVGVSFSEYGSQDIAAAVREVLDHYDHYRATARSHAVSTYAYHNANNVVRTLKEAHA